MDAGLFRRPMRLLHLEDDEGDQALVIETLRLDGLPCEVVAVNDRAGFEAALQRDQYDLIISDFTMPSFDGLGALALAKELSPATPFIFYSGTIGDDVAVESLKQGAMDYIIKQRPHRLATAVRNALHNAEVVYDTAGKLTRMVGVMIDMTERKRAEEKIVEQAALLDEAQDAIIVSDLKGRILFWSKGAERIYGRTVEEVMGKSVDGLLRPAAATSQAAIKETLKTGRWIGEMREQGRSGSEVIVQSRWTLLRDGQGNPKSIMVINSDVTEHKQMEEQFLRSQRLESLGVLVSGIAHDLNNTLAPIIIGIQMLRLDSPAPEIESLLQTMEISARRSADMLKQMLTFARGGEIQKTLIQPADLVKEMGAIVTDTFSKIIECRVLTRRALHPIAGIPTQLHQVLMNLCVNARDAMPKGGTITLNVENVTLTEAETAPHAGAKPGDYVCFSVADTGSGIPPEQLGKIFQPFFTTKAPGKGTGLGLSASSNIVKKHDGFMTVDSQPGHGSKFKVYLPVAGKTVEEPVVERVLLPAGAGECILVIDDEAAILAILRAMLENYGYTVVTAASGPEAIAHLGSHAATVNLVITDLEMPFMDGQTTIAALRKISPRFKTIIVSGSELAAEAASRQLKADAYVVKPFTNEALINTVHQVLTQPEKALTPAPTPAGLVGGQTPARPGN